RLARRLPPLLEPAPRLPRHGARPRQARATPRRRNHRGHERRDPLMIDIAREIEAVQREVGTGRIAAGDARTALLRRTFDADIGEGWNALTTPERISRWFLPISGDLRLGGTFQFEGNAGGEILECDRPNRLKVTWGMGEMAGGAPPSEVEVRLAPVGEGATRFELEHTAIVPDETWDQFGPGAVGVGWEGGFLGLGLHLRGG